MSLNEICKTTKYWSKVAYNVGRDTYDFCKNVERYLFGPFEVKETPTVDRTKIRASLEADCVSAFIYDLRVSENKGNKFLETIFFPKGEVLYDRLVKGNKRAYGEFEDDELVKRISESWFYLYFTRLSDHSLILKHDKEDEVILHPFLEWYFRNNCGKSPSDFLIKSNAPGATPYILKTIKEEHPKTRELYIKLHPETARKVLGLGEEEYKELESKGAIRKQYEMEPQFKSRVEE